MVVDANDAQVKFLDAQYVPQSVHVFAQPVATERYHLLEISNHYSHFKLKQKAEHLCEKSKTTFQDVAKRELDL